MKGAVSLCGMALFLVSRAVLPGEMRGNMLFHAKFFKFPVYNAKIGCYTKLPDKTGFSFCAVLPRNKYYERRCIDAYVQPIGKVRKNFEDLQVFL